MIDRRSLGQTTLSRRQLLASGSRLGAGLAIAATFGLSLTDRALAQAAAKASDAGTIVADEPWARIDRLADGVWAVISKPLDGRYETICNGGIIAGSERTLIVEGFGQDIGAKWVAERAKELSGRPPTDIVVSHFHSDHVAGLAGFVAAKGAPAPTLHATAKTLELVRQDDAERQREPVEARQQLLESASRLDARKATEIDLGGRKVRVHPRAGHTPSDVTVEIDEPSVTFWGDLLWNGMFPNYSHATPSALADTVRATLRRQPDIHVTGHGVVADAEAIASYQHLLDHVESAAREAHRQGQSAADAGKTYQLPKSLADWVLFSQDYPEKAIAAWYRELGPVNAAGDKTS